MAGAIVTAALLLSGLSLITSYQPVIAQNMTGGGGATTIDSATSATGENATTAGGGANQSTSDVRMNIEQARMALQNNDTQGAMMYLDMALSALGGGTQGNMTSTTSGGTTNATTGGTNSGATTDNATSTMGGATTGETSGTEGGGPLEGIFGSGP